MARQTRKITLRRRGASAAPRISPPDTTVGLNITGSGTTGRYLILFERNAAPQAAKTLQRAAGISMASSEDFKEGVVPESLGGAKAVMLPDLAIAISNAPPEQTNALSVASNTGILAVEPERIVHASAAYPEPGFAQQATPERRLITFAVTATR